MNSAFSVTYTRKAAKAHTCEACREPIAPGHTYELWKGVWEGNFFHFKLHPPCNGALYDMDDGDGVDVCGLSRGELADFIRETGGKLLADALAYFQGTENEAWVADLMAEPEKPEPTQAELDGRPFGLSA